MSQNAGDHAWKQEVKPLINKLKHDKSKVARKSDKADDLTRMNSKDI